MRYDQLEAKTRAQRDVQKGQFDQLDEYNRRIRDLRRALNDAQHERDDLKAQNIRIPELQERVTDLQRSNGVLEAELLKLADAPLFRKATDDGADRQARLSELEQHDRRARAEIDHLQSQARAGAERFLDEFKRKSASTRVEA